MAGTARGRSATLLHVILAGEQVRPSSIRLLANLLPDEQLATRLVGALDTDTTIFALSEAQCDGIIVALGEGPPGELAGLHRALLSQRDTRARRRTSYDHRNRARG